MEDLGQLSCDCNEKKRRPWKRLTTSHVFFIYESFPNISILDKRWRKSFLPEASSLTFIGRKRFPKSIDHVNSKKTTAYYISFPLPLPRHSTHHPDHRVGGAQQWCSTMEGALAGNLRSAGFGKRKAKERGEKCSPNGSPPLHARLPLLPERSRRSAGQPVGLR